MTNNNDLQSPAYVSFTTFDNFVKRLKETTVPSQVDGSLLSYTSGSAASQIKTALRFLGLTRVEGDKDRVTQQLHDLVGAYGTGEGWKQQWRKIIADVYDPITKDLDIKTATHQQLSDAIREAGAKGSTDKAVRFFLAALDVVEIKYSPLFKTRGAAAASRPSNGSTTKRKRTRKRSPKGQTGGDRDTPPPEDWQRFDLPLKSAEGKVRIDLPEAMTRREWNYLRTTIEGYFGLAWGEEEETL